MSPSVERLYAIANRKERKIIGLMSGTSLDGLDIALCNISGSGSDTQVQLQQFVTMPYPQHVVDNIRSIFAKENIAFAQLCLLNEWIGELHANYILQALEMWNIRADEIDCIASHGQTVFHAPKRLHQFTEFGNGTLQIGDADHIAVKTGIITLADFRQKHVAAGGEGAPLAMYGDYLLFKKQGEHRLMLNIGGIANFTFLPGDDLLAPVVTDTGPGNTLIDAYTRQHFNQSFDKDAQIASQGKLNKTLLQELKANDFFSQLVPKTTGPELFNLQYLDAALKRASLHDVDPHDILYTLTRFSADTIGAAIKEVVNGINFSMYVSGGGCHNPLLMQFIAEQFPNTVVLRSDALGIPADAKEAILFAILANETIAGNHQPIGFAGMPATSMGKISFPD